MDANECNSNYQYHDPYPRQYRYVAIFTGISTHEILHDSLILHREMVRGITLTRTEHNSQHTFVSRGMYLTEISAHSSPENFRPKSQGIRMSMIRILSIVNTILTFNGCWGDLTMYRDAIGKAIFVRPRTC